MNADKIMSSLKIAWGASAYTGLVPTGKIFYRRAQVPDQLAGFPYLECRIVRVRKEVMTKVDTFNALATYDLRIKSYTAEGMTGGTSTGDQLTDTCNILRALEAVLNNIPPNTAWNNVTEFLHCIPDPGETEVDIDTELYRADVYTAEPQWSILIAE